VLGRTAMVLGAVIVSQGGDPRESGACLAATRALGMPDGWLDPNSDLHAALLKALQSKESVNAG
jgi:hypothetical protein